nr:9038_t:CDS:10 [Entrophospora candida]
MSSDEQKYDDIPKDVINKRIQSEDQLATVRYVGPVPPTKGIWYGVEWDNISRGKHDGLHDGVRYFTCSVPNSGSFIRPSPKIHFGRNLDTIYWAGNTKIEVEAIGWEKIRRKQRQLDRLTEVGLSFERISNAGKPGEIETTCPNIIDLNLSKNLISDWETVARICEQLKKLQVLRLNYNRFQGLTRVPDFKISFTNLKNLSLNYTRIEWKQIELLEPCLLNLENLQLGFNNIKNFGDIDGEKENQIKKSKIKGFSKLKTLNLESNIIDSWDEIARFSGLPQLETLFISNNLINNIYYPKGVDNQEFPKLKYLNVSENKINDWQNVNELNRFPSLEELRIKKNPLFDSIKADEAYILIVGRIKGLKMMNGSMISSNDRIDTERYYLRLCIKDLKSPDEIEKHHPRFKELCEIHGEPTFDDRSSKATSSMLKDRLITLTITHRKSLDEEPIKIISKKLLGTLTLRNLKNIFQKSFGIPASQQRLYAIIKDETVKGTSISKFEMNDDLRQLSYYDFISGDEIIILSK